MHSVILSSQVTHNRFIKVILDIFKTKIDKFSLKFIYFISEQLKIFLLQNNFVKLRGRKDFQRGVGGNGLTKKYTEYLQVLKHLLLHLIVLETV